MTETLTRPAEATGMKPGFFQVLRRHPFLLLFFCLLLFFLEWMYIALPQKGMISASVIYLGSPKGIPPVEFSLIWQQLFNDDNSMISIMESAGFADQANRASALQDLYSMIRPSLKYGLESPRIARISFTHHSPEKIKRFLSVFSSSLIKHLQKQARKAFSDEKRTLFSRLTYHSRQKHFIRQLTGITSGTALESLTELANRDAPLITNSTFSLSLPAEGGSPEFWKSLGYFIDNELDWNLFLSGKNYEALCEPLPGDPIEPVIFSDPETPVLSTQPFQKVIIFLIPISIFLLGVSTILLVEKVGRKRKGKAQKPI